MDVDETIALPKAMAVTTPLSSTDAISWLLEVQTIDLSVALAGVTIAESATFSVTFKLALLFERVILLTGIPVTLISQVAVTLDPSSAEHVITTSPGESAETRPLDDTEASAELLLFHSTSLIEAKDG